MTGLAVATVTPTTLAATITASATSSLGRRKRGLRLTGRTGATATGATGTSGPSGASGFVTTGSMGQSGYRQEPGAKIAGVRVSRVGSRRDAGGQATTSTSRRPLALLPALFVLVSLVLGC